MIVQTSNAQLPRLSWAAVAAVPPSVPHERQGEHRPLIRQEDAWRQAPTTAAPGRIRATRWTALEKTPMQVRAYTPPDIHLVKIILRTTDIRLKIGGETIHDGIAATGMLHMSDPGAAAECLFRGASDTLHLHVPDSLIATHQQEADPRQRPSLRSQGRLVRDPVAERLGHILLASDELGATYGSMYLDCLNMAVVARLLSVGREEPKSHTAPLPKWRLNRAIDYIESHLAEPIRLADIASTAGLTRMYFAAQFRASTGLRPHEYLLRRRVERAQEMLLANRTALVQVALSVGFQTQSHFTTVFARFVGQTPRAWRLANMSSAAPVMIRPPVESDRELVISRYARHGSHQH